MKNLQKWLGTSSVFAIMALAWLEVWRAGWASGHFLGRFSAKWTITLALFLFIFAALLFIFNRLIWQPEKAKKITDRFVEYRQHFKVWRWLGFVLTAWALSWFFLFSPWAGLFIGFFFRLLVFMLSVGVATFLLTDDADELITWTSFWTTSLALGVIFSVAKQWVGVTDYPFALHWSEGNRLYDYSLMYGQRLYDYPLNEPLRAHIDPGRQSLWGLPFLFLQQPSIGFARLWHVIIVSVPYLLLGMVAGYVKNKKTLSTSWVFFALWVYLFLSQGPIYAPLVLAAVLVAGAWRSPWWIALPLILLSSYYAYTSRLSWMFAPALWAGMLAFAGVNIAEREMEWQDWFRGLVYGLVGVMGSFGVVFLWPILSGRFNRLFASEASVDTAGSVGAAEVVTGSVASATEDLVSASENVAMRQTLLWSRLWPNASFSTGVVLGLLVASLPLIVLLIYMVRKKVWRVNLWQVLAVLAPLGAFLAVGLAASAKVGGGLDLHNLDMFLIALVFIAAIAWKAGLAEYLRTQAASKPFVRIALTLSILVPAFMPMIDAYPLDLPSADKVTSSVDGIRSYVECAEQYGEVLFIDQRQLLTFGYLDTPLVPEFEKKVLMDAALDGNGDYFADFYAELEDARFSLIIADPQWVVEKEGNESLAAENNAWVQWVSAPLLERYESVNRYKGVKVELYMPIGRNYMCP